MLNTRTIAVKVVLSAKVYYLGIKTKVFYQMRLIKNGTKLVISLDNEACASIRLVESAGTIQKQTQITQLLTVCL